MLNEISDRRPRVGARWKGEIRQTAVASNDRIGAELTHVIGGPRESCAGSNEARIHPDRAD